MPHKIEITELTQVVHNEKNFLTALNQNLLRIQEAIDDTLSRTARIPNQMEDVLDMNGKRIINIGRSEGPRDIVTREEIQGLIDSAAASVEELSRLVEEARISLQEYGRQLIQEASEARDEAVASAGESATSATNAATSATNAETYKTQASGYASNASNHATQAQASAQQAATWFNRIYGARKQTQAYIIGTPSGSYTGGTDKIETGVDLTDKTVDLFYNGQLIKTDGNWEIDEEDVVFSGLTPTVGSTMVIWINDTARMVDVGDLTAHNRDSNAHPQLKSTMDTKIAAHNTDTSAHSDIRGSITTLTGTVTDKVIIRQWS